MGGGGGLGSTFGSGSDGSIENCLGYNISAIGYGTFCANVDGACESSA